MRSDPERYLAFVLFDLGTKQERLTVASPALVCSPVCKPVGFPDGSPEND